MVEPSPHRSAGPRSVATVPNVPEMLMASFEAALAAADPLKVVAPHLPPPGAGRTVVVGAGKGAAAMARAVEDAWPGIAPEGIVITRYGHAVPTRRIRVVEAGHPVPDPAGQEAAIEILERARALSDDDLLLVLLSGGGSSLMSLPAPGMTLDDLQALNRELLRCGAPVSEMNIVRKHVSAISGGRLAQASAARVVALIISDVTGDDPSAIASGPCSPDPSTYLDALAIIARYGVVAPASVARHLEQGAAGAIEETPKPGSAMFARVENRIIANPHACLDAGARYLRSQGVACALLGDTVAGEARDVAKVYAALVREIRGHGQPWPVPVALLSGGECTVTLPATSTHRARGGRCAEFLLALAVELGAQCGAWALACDTDGIDGSEDNAGARVAPDTLARGAALALSAREALDRHDSWGFFSALGDLIVTGPTRTNVNDYRVILVT